MARLSFVPGDGADSHLCRECHAPAEGWGVFDRGHSTRGVRYYRLPLCIRCLYQNHIVDTSADTVDLRKAIKAERPMTQADLMRILRSALESQ